MTSKPPARLRSGDRVRHPKLGLGQVLHVEGDKAEIFFLDAGLRKIATTRFPLTPLVPRPDHWRLDRLDVSRVSLDAPERPYRSVRQCIESFIAEYPDGFGDEKYLGPERNYKVAAHREAVALLHREELDGLVGEGNYSEVCTRAKGLANVRGTGGRGFGLVNWRDSDNLWKQVLGDGALEEAFAARLRTLLYGVRNEDVRFEQFVSWLDSLGAANWSLSTYFRWLLFPDQDVLVQPGGVKAAADAWRYDVGYSPQVTWDGYRRIRDFCGRVRDELAELEPEDFIDVQFFMFVTSQHDS